MGQKWKLPILWHLHEAKATRYLELRRRIPGITYTMLTKSLRELEEAGLVNRHNYGTVPPRVDYALTEDGEALLPALNELYRWGKRICVRRRTPRRLRRPDRDNLPEGKQDAEPEPFDPWVRSVLIGLAEADGTT